MSLFNVYTCTYNSKKNFYLDKQNTAPCEFLFKIFNPSQEVLTSYGQAEQFVIDYIKTSTNHIPINFINSETWCTQREGKILLASKVSEEYIDPALTLKRLKLFFKVYRKGVICFK